MKLRGYRPEDFDACVELFVKHDLHPDVMKLASDTGFIAFDETGIKGCVFLYKTNAPWTFIDLFCVDSTLTKAQRTEVIDGFLQVFSAISRIEGFHSIMAEPRFVASHARLKKHGFVEKVPGQFWLEL